MKKPILKILALTAVVGIASFVLLLLFKLMVLALMVGGLAILAKRIFFNKHAKVMEPGTAMMHMVKPTFSTNSQWGRDFSPFTSSATVVPIY